VDRLPVATLCTLSCMWSASVTPKVAIERSVPHTAANAPFIDHSVMSSRARDPMSQVDCGFELHDATC
jgi:hypothetical protein